MQRIRDERICAPAQFRQEKRHNIMDLYDDLTGRLSPDLKHTDLAHVAPIPALAASASAADERVVRL